MLGIPNRDSAGFGLDGAADHFQGIPIPSCPEPADTLNCALSCLAQYVLLPRKRVSAAAMVRAHGGEHGQGGPPVPGGPAADLVLVQAGQALAGIPETT
jgi:hypothetical protein